MSWGYLEVTNSARGNDYCLTSEPPSSVDPQLAFVQTTTCNYNVSVPTMAAGTTNAQVVYAMSDGSFYSANALNGAGGCLASSFNNGALINQYAASGGSHLLFKQCDGARARAWRPRARSGQHVTACAPPPPHARAQAR